MLKSEQRVENLDSRLNNEVYWLKDDFLKDEGSLQAVGSLKAEDSLHAEGFLKEIEKLKLSASSILKQEVTSLQVIPPILVNLLKLNTDETSSISDLLSIINTEPSISFEILRLVNSAHFNFPYKIASIKHAMAALGFSEIHKIALNLLFYKKMIKASGKQEFNQLFFWQHCLFVATLSKTIAIKINHPEPDLVYAAGLLHDIGKIALEHHGQLTYSDFIVSFDPGSNSSLDYERYFFGITHSEIGAVICHLCDLPDSISSVILNYHSGFKTSGASSGLSTEIKQSIAIVSYANYIASLHGIGSVENNHCPKLHADVSGIINTFNLEMESVLEPVEKELRSLSSFYGIQFPHLHRLRANLLESVCNFDFAGNVAQGLKPVEPLSSTNNSRVNSLIAPHRSLNPEEFVPWTLEAIQRDFNFDRLIVLIMDPKHRSLVAQYWWPENIIIKKDKPFKIKISSLSGQLLSCLRNKQATYINDAHEEDRQILQELQVKEFFSLPILTNNRLSSILYVDNAISRRTLDDKFLPELINITTELGIALKNARKFAQEKKKAQIDPLTGLNNKGMIQHFLGTYFDTNKSQLNRLAVGFIDIDHFKNFNDTYGHQAGDDVLKIVADILKNLTRPGDFVGRYGGEEFLFILVDSGGVRYFAERIRMAIEQTGEILSNRFSQQSLTASIGVARYHEKYSNYQQLIAAADEAMYQSKECGRNRVTVLS